LGIFLNFWILGFFKKNAPDDRPGAWQWLVVAEGVAVAGWQWVENLGCELGSILSGEKSEIGRVLTELGRLEFFVFLEFWILGFLGCSR
jgi:hypothetical protein